VVDVDVVPDGLVLSGVAALIGVDGVVRQPFDVGAEKGHHFVIQGEYGQPVNTPMAEEAPVRTNSNGRCRNGQDCQRAKDQRPEFHLT